MLSSLLVTSYMWLCWSACAGLAAWEIHHTDCIYLHSNLSVCICHSPGYLHHCNYPVLYLCFTLPDLLYPVTGTVIWNGNTVSFLHLVTGKWLKMTHNKRISEEQNEVCTETNVCLSISGDLNNIFSLPNFSILPLLPLITQNSSAEDSCTRRTCRQERHPGHCWTLQS